ncbi:hypothetical protein Tco_0711523 [Tanacetum coccineum]
MENSFTLASTEAVEKVKIVQYCNGLLLCTQLGLPTCNYIYNPSTNLFKMLPAPDYSHADLPLYTSSGLRMAFDPTKSLNYKATGSCARICLTSLVLIILTVQSIGALQWLETKDIQDRYLVNTDDFMNLLSKGWLIWSIVWSVVLGEREEDSCLAINLSGKVVEYNLISKTLHEIYDIRSNQLDDDELIPPFAADHNVYEFIPSFESV